MYYQVLDEEFIGSGGQHAWGAALRGLGGEFAEIAALAPAQVTSFSQYTQGYTWLISAPQAVIIRPSSSPAV